jgi:glucose/mannose-6-phosphate isomerase
MGEMFRKGGLPLVELVPGLQPRAALGYSFVPLMLIFNSLGWSPYNEKHFSNLADFLDNRISNFAVETPSDDNRAKQLALQLYGRISIIYSGPDLTDAVATRFKGQICENAKTLAFANQFPEFNHNELVGWKIINAFREYLRVIILRDADDHPRVAARMNIVGEMIKKENVGIAEINSEGSDRLQRMMSLIQFGDFTSFYLAILNKVDPTPVTAIDYLKNELATIV